LSEAISIEKTHLIGAANFGVMKNTFGYDFKTEKQKNKCANAPSETKTANAPGETSKNINA